MLHFLLINTCVHWLQICCLFRWGLLYLLSLKGVCFIHLLDLVVAWNCFIALFYLLNGVVSFLLLFFLIGIWLLQNSSILYKSFVVDWLYFELTEFCSLMTS